MTDHTPKPKPRKGETQQENESGFEYDLKAIGLDIDSTNKDPNYVVSNSGTVTNSDGITLTFPDNMADLDDTTSSSMGATYIAGTTASVTEGFMTSEEEHEKLRERYPALKKGYDHYRTLLKMAENGPDDLDN